MGCVKCGRELSADFIFCPYCGKKQVVARSQNVKRRGNGQGTVFRRGRKYVASVTTGWHVGDDGKKRRSVHQKTFDKKSDAIAALPSMLSDNKPKRQDLTFEQLYTKWLPTHRAGKSTIDCYKSAYKHFRPVWAENMSDIDVDDLQDCIDNCGKGKRTRENMKALCGLLYKYGIPRQAVPDNLNLAPFLIVGGGETAHRVSFTDIEIEKIRQQIGVTDYADYVYCLIYLGFRPTEFLDLTVERYDRARSCFIGGGKTAAGIDRVVTIAPKILPYIDAIAGNRAAGAMFCDSSGAAFNLRDFTDKVFYPVLAAAEIDNPLVEIGGGVMRHKYTPHSCRHTFATLLKRVNAPSKDKQELIGHATEEMLKYYQDVDIDDLRRITDAL